MCFVMQFINNPQKKMAYVGICLPPMEKPWKTRLLVNVQLTTVIWCLCEASFMCWEILVTLGPKVTYTRKISQDCLSILNV